MSKIILGIESTAHTFGIAIIQDQYPIPTVLANERALFTTEEGGMIPGEVADHHVEKAPFILKQALEKANISIDQIDAIAFSQSPGIGHTLRIGAATARKLSLELKKPLIGVNHCIAHLEIGRILAQAKDPVLLYASGANTQIIAYEAKKYRVFGETLDIGIGNFLDQLGRYMNLGFPAGPKIEQLAKKSNTYIELPYSVKGMDISLGGLLTKLKTMIDSKQHAVEDICFSVQETTFAMLIEVAERALAHTQKTELVLGGGVACNTRLQEMARIMCEERNAKMFCPKKEFLIDNAAMIALNGLQKLKVNDTIEVEQSKIDPYLRTDEVEVTWR